MLLDVVVYAVFLSWYVASLIILLLKRPDRRINSKRFRAILAVGYLLGALVIVWFTVNLLTMLRN